MCVCMSVRYTRILMKRRALYRRRWASEQLSKARSKGATKSNYLHVRTRRFAMPSQGVLMREAWSRRTAALTHPLLRASMPTAGKGKTPCKSSSDNNHEQNYVVRIRKIRRIETRLDETDGKNIFGFAPWPGNGR
jgi:hypothetical protein